MLGRSLLPRAVRLLSSRRALSCASSAAKPPGTAHRRRAVMVCGVKQHTGKTSVCMVRCATRSARALRTARTCVRLAHALRATCTGKHHAHALRVPVTVAAAAAVVVHAGPLLQPAQAAQPGVGRLHEASRAGVGRGAQRGRRRGLCAARRQGRRPRLPVLRAQGPVAERLAGGDRPG